MSHPAKALVLMASLVACTSAGAQEEAQMTVTFRDGAPKDRIVFANTGPCALAAMDVTLDLVGSPSNLIFDVTNEGAGVEVFQPVEIVTGVELVTALTEVEDGATALVFQTAVIPQEGTVAFTVDLDDTVGTREITVSGAEIQGAQVRIGMDVDAEGVVFDETGTAVLSGLTCAPLQG